MDIYEGKSVSDSVLVNFFRDEIERKKRMRVQPEKQWMINANFLVGNHYLRYNRARGVIESYRPTDYDIAINLTRAKHKAMKSALISDEPTFATRPDDYTEEAQHAATVRNRWLEKQWEELEGQKYASEAAHIALVQSRAVTWVDYDDNKLTLETLDAFDTFIDTIPLQKGMYVIRTGYAETETIKSRKKIGKDGELVNVYKVPRSGLTTGEIGHESQYKTQLENMTNGQSEPNETRAKIAEIYYKKYDTKSGDYKVWVVTINGKNVLRNENTGYDFFPCAVLPLDIEPGQTEALGWAKDIVEINRQVNRLERNKAQYHDMAAKFRLVTDDTKAPRILTNENGQVIRVTPGAKFQQMTMQSYPASVDTELAFLLDRTEDLSVRDITTGRTPSGVTAAIAIDSLIAADARNNTNFRSAYKEYIKDLGEIILKMTAKNLKTIEAFNYEEEDGMHQYQVTGEEPISLNKVPGDVVQILSDTQVTVTVGSALGQTARGRQETIMSLYERNIVDNPDFVLRQFDIDATDARLDQQQDGQKTPFTLEDIQAKAQQVEAQGGDPDNDPEVQQMIAALERVHQAA